MKPVKFIAEAEREADQALDWYESQSASAEVRFTAELQAAYRAIQKAPGLYSAYLHGTQRRLLDRFPFSVVYRELLDSIQIVAVAHAKRRPGYWKSRI